MKKIMDHKKIWCDIDEWRYSLSLLQSEITSDDYEKIDESMNYYFFPSRCKSLAKFLNTFIQEHFKEDSTKSLYESLELLASEFSIYENDVKLTTNRRKVLGRVTISENQMPNLQINRDIEFNSTLRAFTLSHEIVHLMTHLQIPDVYRKKSQLILGENDEFEEPFAASHLFFSANDQKFSHINEMIAHLENQNVLETAFSFIENRDKILSKASRFDFYRYHKEVAADLVSSYLPFSNFDILYENLPPDIKVATLPGKDDPDYLTDLLDLIGWAFASESVSEEVDPQKIYGYITMLILIAHETGWFSPKYVFLSLATLVNFFASGRVFPLDNDEQTMRRYIESFYVSIGIPVIYT